MMEGMEGGMPGAGIPGGAGMPPPGMGGAAGASARPNAPPEGWTKWAIVYPCYVDGNKTLKQGRRIPKSIAERCKGVHIGDVMEAIVKLGLRCGHEPKLHPQATREREMGRARVELKHVGGDRDGELVNPDIPNSGGFFFIIDAETALLYKLAEIIPELPNRPVRQAQLEAQEKRIEDLVLNKIPMPGMPGMPPGAVDDDDEDDDEEGAATGGGKKKGGKKKGKKGKKGKKK